MEGPLPPHAPDTTSLPTTRERLGDWGPTWPTAHSPARGVRGPRLPRDRPGAVSPCRPGCAHPRGTRAFEGSAQPYLPAKGLRAWKEATFLASLPSSSERPLSVKPFEREAPGLHFLQAGRVGRGCRFAGSEMVPPHPHGRRHRSPAFSPLCRAGAGRGQDINLRTGAHPSPSRGKGATAGTEGQLLGRGRDPGQGESGGPLAAGRAWG